MKRLVMVFLVGGVLGVVAGFAVGIFVYPFWFLRDVATETLDPTQARSLRAEGQFVHANPSDPVHWGTGRVSVLAEEERTLVFLHEDFEVGPGPRYHLFLVDHDNVRDATTFTESARLDLGRLRAFKGSQVYSLPAGADAAAFKSAVVWCVEFDVLISPARLVAAPR